MTEEIETYLNINPYKFEIYLFDKKKNINLYKKEKNIDDKFSSINFNSLNNFLDEHIFKIEKLTGKFIKNINLIISHEKILETNLGIKKKNYDKNVSKKILDNILIEFKELFKETYQDRRIMHMLINKYTVDGKIISKIENDISSNFLCIETKFISIPDSFAFEIDEILKKYQIKIVNFLDYQYLNNLFKNENMEIPQMVEKVLSGYNQNEVIIVPKTYKKLGFFEKFFHLFS